MPVGSSQVFALAGLLGAAACAVAAGSVGSAEPRAVTLADRVCAQAREKVQSAADRSGLQAQVTCRHVPGLAGMAADAVVEPEGSPPALRSGPASVFVRVRAAARAPVLVAVPLTLQLRSPAWVAEQPVPAGTLITAAAFARREVDWPLGATPAVAGDTPPAGRLRSAVRAGEALTAAHLIAADTAATGDRVTLLVRTAGLEISSTARLVAAARVGGEARAQRDGGSVLVTGTLVDPATVLVGPKEPR